MLEKDDNIGDKLSFKDGITATSLLLSLINAKKKNEVKPTRKKEANIVSEVMWKFKNEQKHSQHPYKCKNLTKKKIIAQKVKEK